MTVAPPHSLRGQLPVIASGAGSSGRRQESSKRETLGVELDPVYQAGMPGFCVRRVHDHGQTGAFPQPDQTGWITVADRDHGAGRERTVRGPLEQPAEGVGRLVELAAEAGRAVDSHLETGVCGEHGGDPASIHFFHRAGLDHVSCSPFRIPTARLEAGRAALTGAADSDSR
ncbi:hypothetical protein SUDANB1_07726 [Streptomyces sp. enrichment culture]